MVEDRITDTEKIAHDIIQSNWDNALRTTPRAIEQFEEEFPDACEIVNRKVQEEGVENLGNVFRPGVPDFLAFDDNGDYTFIEVKGEGDGLRHSQLKWFADFQGLNAEIWFTDSNDGITEKMNSDNLNAYSLKKPDSAQGGNAEVKESGEKGFLNVQIPETLAAVMNLEEGDKVSWSIKNRSILELDTD
ncbi:MAG: VRR-NUC domain-containing protein [Candidatus Aenigmatarchaeota archaeon]